MEFKIDYSLKEGAWVLTVENTNWVYQRLKQCLEKVRLLIEESETEPEKEE